MQVGFDMNRMKAVVLNGPGGRLLVDEVVKPEPKAGEVLIELRAASINHRDLWIRAGDYGTLKYPCIMGSDGAGVVVATGSEADSRWMHQKVIINPSLNWGDQRAGQGNNFQILGVPSQGTFAEYICVSQHNIHPLPEGYDFEKAAALPLAGLTAHRALFYRGDLQRGQKVLITGIGGGVAAFVLGFSIRAGAEAYVTSSSAIKIDTATKLGAEYGVNYTKAGWESQLLAKVPEGFDLIIDSAGGPGFPSLIKLLKTGGKIVTFGRTAGNIPEISPALIFYKQISILGTTMGSPADFEGMLDFINEHNMRPVIDKVFPLQECESAFLHIEKNAQFGKVILQISE